MARPARIEYEGAFYHVMNRGNRREAIFIDNHDRARFYEIIGNIESRYKIIIYSFVLMSNHYHLIIETPLGNLSRAIQRLNGDYALYFSRRHRKPGHLFQGRFKAMLVEKETYLLGQRYGGISDSAVNKVVSRFCTRLSKDKKLNAKIKKIVSNGEM